MTTLITEATLVLESAFELLAHFDYDLGQAIDDAVSGWGLDDEEIETIAEREGYFTDYYCPYSGHNVVGTSPMNSFETRVRTALYHETHTLGEKYADTVSELRDIRWEFENIDEDDFETEDEYYSEWDRLQEEISDLEGELGL